MSLVPKAPKGPLEPTYEWSVHPLTILAIAERDTVLHNLICLRPHVFIFVNGLTSWLCEAT